MATVNFTVEDLVAAFQDNWHSRHGVLLEPQVRALWNQLDRARAGSGVSTALDNASDLMDGMGVEAIRVEGAYADQYHGDIVATYVNMGDTYALTLVHDSENNSFHLTTYGDWVEAYEAEHRPEDSCSDCGQMFPVDELKEGICKTCRTPYPPDDALEIEVWSVDGGPKRLESAFAWWADEELLMDGTPELRVTKPRTWPIWATTAARLAKGDLTLLSDIGWRLSKDSLSEVLVAMDQFLESH